MKPFFPLFENENYENQLMNCIQSIIDFQNIYKTQYEKLYDYEQEYENDKITKKHNHITVLSNSSIFKNVYDLSIGPDSHAHKCHENSWRMFIERELDICAGVIFPIIITKSKMKQYIPFNSKTVGTYIEDLTEHIFEWPIKNAGIHFWNIKNGKVLDSTLYARNYIYVGHKINVTEFHKQNEPAGEMFTYWKNQLILNGIFPVFKDLKIV